MKYNDLDIVNRLFELTDYNHALSLYLLQKWITLEKSYDHTENIKALEDAKQLIQDFIVKNVMRTAKLDQEDVCIMIKEKRERE